MDKPLAILLPLAFLLMLAQQANAGLYVGYANSDFYFEVNYGGAYTYMRTPYTYAYNDYYYFDYPFRVYSTGAYNYYQPGWYAFDPYWSFAPPATLNYTYYPPSYYYYNSAWTYYPDWIHTYGPAYYGSYYLPPSQPTLVGQSYQPQKEAGCNEASIVSYTINLQPGEKRHATFRLDNNSRKFLDIENVSVSPNGFGIRISNVKFEKVVSNNSSGNIEFDVFADEDAPRGMQGATIEVAATFRDGTFCPSPSISEDFTVDVAAPQRPKLQGSKPAPEAPTAKGSTSYLRPKDDSFAHFDEIKNTNTQSQEQSVTIIVNQDNAGQDDTSVRQCSDLSMSGSGITVVSGQSATNYIQFRNFAAEDFIIDAVEPVSHSSAFTIEAGRDFRKVFAGQVAAIKAGFFAPETGTDEKGAAYLKVRGHFDSGLECTVISQGFDVLVAGKPQAELKGFSLSLPSAAQFTGTSGFITFDFENPTGSTVELNVFAGGASVSPNKFSLAPRTAGKRTVAVNDVNRNATVFFSASAGQREFLQKSVVVTARPAQSAPIPAPNPPAGTSPPPAGNGIGSAFAAGLAILGQGTVLAGILILGAIAALVLFRFATEPQKQNGQ